MFKSLKTRALEIAIITVAALGVLAIPATFLWSHVAEGFAQLPIVSPIPAGTTSYNASFVGSLGTCVDLSGGQGTGMICGPDGGVASGAGASVVFVSAGVTAPYAVVQHVSDAGTSGVLAALFPVAFNSALPLPDCTCSNTNGTVVACDITSRSYTGVVTKSGSGTDVQQVICAQ